MTELLTLSGDDGILLAVGAGVFFVLVVAVAWRRRSRRRSSVPHARGSPHAPAVSRPPPRNVQSAVDSVPRLDWPTSDDDLDAEMTRLAPSMAPGKGRAAADSVPELRYEPDAAAGIDDPTGPIPLVAIEAAGQSDKGIARRRNDDAYLVDPELELYIVADGMGGHSAGDVASRMVVDEVRAAVQKNAPVTGHGDRPRGGRELIAALERANEAIQSAGRRDKNLLGMGAAAIVARCSTRRQRLFIAHIGDCRAYRLRAGALEKITREHTLAARGVTDARASLVVRAVGPEPAIKVDLVVDKPHAGDLYLFCTDGLPRMLDEDTIRRIALEERERVSQTVANLVAAANAAGGRDNITLVAFRVRPAA